YDLLVVRSSCVPFCDLRHTSLAEHAHVRADCVRVASAGPGRLDGLLSCGAGRRLAAGRLPHNDVSFIDRNPSYRNPARSAHASAFYTRTSRSRASIASRSSSSRSAPDWYRILLGFFINLDDVIRLQYWKYISPLALLATTAYFLGINAYT